MARTAAEIRARIDAIDEARAAIVDDNALSVSLGDRQITRPQLGALRRERNALVMSLNQLEAGNGAFFAHTVRTVPDDSDRMLWG